jgi:methylamine dehydrogenase accessory protein MauD
MSIVAFGRDGVQVSAIGWVTASPVAAAGIGTTLLGVGILAEVVRRRRRDRRRAQSPARRNGDRRMPDDPTARPDATIPPASPFTQAGLRVGSPAPGFVLTVVSGGEVSLDDLRARGRLVLLVFSHPDCRRCRKLQPRLAELQVAHADTITVAIVSQGGVESNRRFGTRHPLAPVLVQQDREVAHAYGASTLPAAVLIRTDGSVASGLAVGEEAILEVALGAVPDTA